MADYSVFEAGLARWLRAVWAGREKIKKSANEITRTEGAYCVYDLYNNPIASGTDTPQWRAFVKKMGVLKSSFNVSVYPQNRERVWKPNDFYHFGPEMLAAGQGEWRVYAHVKSPRGANWEEPATYLLKLMLGRGGEVAKFKVAGPGMAADRGDQIVVWTNSDRACEVVLKGLSAMAAHFDGRVPPSVCTVLPGLGWAKEPSDRHASPAIDEAMDGTRHSFGSYLAAIIFMGLEQSWDGTEDHFVYEVEQFFLNVGVDPLRPHLLRTMSWDDILGLAGLANRRLVVTAPPLPALAVPRTNTQLVPL